MRRKRKNHDMRAYEAQTSDSPKVDFKGEIKLQLVGV